MPDHVDAFDLGEFLDSMRGESELPEGYYEECAEFIAGAAEALQHAHEAGVVHRDLKPSNILMTPEGTPKITDFGIAKDLDNHSQQLTKTGATLGTPSFAPPEQVGGDRQVDGRADVYSLGSTLFALLTGRPPFEGTTILNVVRQVLREDPPRPSSLRDREAIGR